MKHTGHGGGSGVAQSDIAGLRFEPKESPSEPRLSAMELNSISFHVYRPEGKNQVCQGSRAWSSLGQRWHGS